MPSLSQVDTWLYHLGDVNGARADAIAATNADMVVTEWASYARDEDPYTPADLDRMRGDDGDRLILSYLSIGEAETYRYYWDTDWQDTAPSWLGEENPEWEGNIKVRYWDDSWQDIIFDYVDRIVDGGFNGLYLDIVDAYDYWGRRDRAPGVDTAQEMADFVAAIRDRADARIAATDPGRDFHIIGQNALDLIRNGTYADAIDGVAREDARFYYPNGNPRSFDAWDRDEYDYTLNLLERAERMGLSGFVVEYIPEGEVASVSNLLTGLADDLGAAGIPLYIADNRDLDTIPEQPDEIDNGVFPPLGPADGENPGGNTITGTRASETLRGTAEDDIIVAKGGSDTAYGRGGDDIIGGGGGGDDLFGNAGSDALSGQGGADNLFGGGGRDILSGGGKADLLRGGGGADTLLGGSGPDDLFGGAGADVIVGGKGGDILSGGGGADVFIMTGRSGEDEITDFDPARDRIDLPDDASPDISQLNRGLYIDFATGAVLLRDVLVADFDAATMLI